MILMLELAEKNLKEAIKTMKNMLIVKRRQDYLIRELKQGTGWKSLKILLKT